MTAQTERAVDVMMDLRERMVRIETKLDVKADRELEVDVILAALTARTTAIETQAVVLKTHINTLRWVGASVAAFLGAFGSSLSHALQIVK